MRGEDYALAGRVRILQDAGERSGSLVATVRGTAHYDVLISRQARTDGLAIVVDCTCPHFVDHGAACKHIWATLSVADRQGLLVDVGADDDVYLDYLDEFGDDVEPDEAVRAAAVRPAAGRRMPPPARSPGDVFISELTQGLEQIASSAAPPFRYLHGELLYVIEPPEAHLPGLRLTTHSRVKTKSGEWGKAKPAGITAADVDAAPDLDRPILAALLGARQEYAGYGGYGAAPWQPPTASFVLSRYVAEQVLPAVARTGRLYVRYERQSDALAPVAWDAGEPWALALDVAPVERGYLVSAGFTRTGEHLALDEVRMLLASAFLLARDRLMPVTLPRIEDSLLIGTLAGRGSIEVVGDDVPKLADALARAGVPAATLPEALRFTEIDVAPAPILRLRREHHYGANPRLEAAVAFDYGGITAPDDRGAILIDAASRRLVRRRPDAERAAAARLTEVGMRASFDHRTRRNTVWVSPANLPRVARDLTADGWRVEAEGRLWRTPGQIRMSVTSGIDWFDLQATIDFGDTQADLPRVLAALRRGEGFVTLDDGSLGMVPEDWLKRYGALVATATAENGSLRFRGSQALLLDALLAAQADQADVAFDAGFRKIRDELTRFEHVAPVDEPASFRGTLRPYQKDALAWFRFLRGFGFGGCLADDMGLGKTIMVLALLAWRREEFLRTGEGLRTSAIVVPRSLVANWVTEAAAFATDLRVVDYSSTRRGEHEAAMADTDVLLMTYGTLRQDVVRLKDAEFEYVILDEAQAIKNAASASAKAARLLRGRHRLALSGTPVENHLGELWSLFEFLNPGLLGSSSVFLGATARTQPDPETASLLSRGLKPFFLRRTKGQVARDLPARTEQTIHCELDKPGRALYDGLRKHYRDSLMTRIDRVGVARSGLQVLEALLRLRQAACHPGLLDATKAAESSAKFDVLLPRLRDVIAEGHKALVFSQFTSLLSLLARHLDEEAVPYEYLDGRTRNRAERVERFQTDAAVPLFLVSLKAGGLGLNLTAAEYVFLLDPWWNPAVEAQAIDRAHRIGQTREVFACRIIAKDTVEEKVLALQQSKRALADAVLAESATGLRHLTRDDLELLLS